MANNNQKSTAEPSIPFTEILKSIPEFFGLRVNEEPAYETIEEHGDIQIRRYEPQLLATVTVPNLGFDEYREFAFKKLANYIFGGNVRQENMAMTAPVLQQSSGSEQMAMTAPVLQEKSSHNVWSMSFVLPSKYELATVPVPQEDDVIIDSRPAHEVAVIRYSGNNSLEKMQAHEGQLKNWLNSQHEWQAEGGFYCAQYDAPFVIPLAKRNEIHIRVRRAH